MQQSKVGMRFAPVSTFLWFDAWIHCVVDCPFNWVFSTIWFAARNILKSWNAMGRTLAHSQSMYWFVDMPSARNKTGFWASSVSAELRCSSFLWALCDRDLTWLVFSCSHFIINCIQISLRSSAHPLLPAQTEAMPACSVYITVHHVQSLHISVEDAHLCKNAH